MLTTHANELSALSPQNLRPAGVPQRYGKLWSSLKEVCDLLRIPVQLAADEHQFQHVQFKTGQRIHTIGQPFDALYIVNSGFLKTVMIDDFGNEQVLSFPMKGDLFGIDGIHSKQYTTETVALTSCDVILLPFRTLSLLSRTHSELEVALYGVMSRELVREQTMAGALGSLGAEARIARFLVQLAQRFTDMGYSGTQFNLRMTRQEIGSYLGLTLETVSRTFSAFNTMGLVSVDQRAIVIHDLKALSTLRRLAPAQHRVKAKKALAEARSSDTPPSLAA